MKQQKTPEKKSPKIAAKNYSLQRAPGQGKSQELAAEKNAAPSQWGRRLARLVGAKFGVDMVENHAKNEGTYKGKDICIKCAKSPMPPVSVLMDMLKRIDQLWAVYVLYDGTAEVWAVDSEKIHEHAYFTHGAKVQKRAEMYLRRIKPVGELIGTLTEEEVASCRIP